MLRNVCTFYSSCLCSLCEKGGTEQEEYQNSWHEVFSRCWNWGWNSGIIFLLFFSWRSRTGPAKTVGIMEDLSASFQKQWGLLFGHPMATAKFMLGQSPETLKLSYTVTQNNKLVYPATILRGISYKLRFRWHWCSTVLRTEVQHFWSMKDCYLFTVLVRVTKVLCATIILCRDCNCIWYRLRFHWCWLFTVRPSQ